MELALIHRRTPLISLSKVRSVSTVFNETRCMVVPWWLWGSIVRVEWALIHIPQRFADTILWLALPQTLALDDCMNSYPGSFNVLFMEYAKCLPKEVNSRGL